MEPGCEYVEPGNQVRPFIVRSLVFSVATDGDDCCVQRFRSLIRSAANLRTLVNMKNNQKRWWDLLLLTIKSRYAGEPKKEEG